MGISVFPAASSGKTRRIEVLRSGTSWTVPAGVTYVNVTLVGGGGGSGSGHGTDFGGNAGNTGGTTTFTGATSAVGGAGLSTSGGQASNNQGAQWGVAVAGIANTGIGARGYIYGGAASNAGRWPVAAQPEAQSGQTISSIVTTTPGASITYAIGAGGTPGAQGGGGAAGQAGGSGRIDIEYWV